MPRNHTTVGYSVNPTEVQNTMSGSQNNMMSCHASSFPFSQTAPADPSGTAWENSTVTVTQRYASTHLPGQGAQMHAPRQTMPQYVDDSVPWTNQAPASKPQSQEMRRIVSKSSSHGHRIAKNSVSTNNSQKLQKALARGTSEVLGMNMTSDRSSFTKLPLEQGRAMDVDDFLLRGSASGMIPAQLAESQLYTGVAAMPWEGMPFGDFIMDLSAGTMPLDMETSLDGGSPSYSNSGSSPEQDDSWHPMRFPVSPPETTASGSPEHFTMDDFTLPGSHTHMLFNEHEIPMSGLLPGVNFSESPTWSSRRSSGDGESARNHDLYKVTAPAADGLFHCPWEGEDNCNHRPEKLKCNYDKFVDSHLKPYKCKVEACESARFSSTACLLRHEREAHAMHGHGDKPYLCTTPGCERAQPGNGFPRNWNLRDHMRRVHSTELPGLVEGDKSSSTGVSSSSKDKESSKARKHKNDAASSSSKIKVSSSSSAAGSKKTPSRTSTMKTEDLFTEREAMLSTNDQIWATHHATLSGLVGTMTSHGDAQILEQLVKARSQIDAMTRIVQEGAAAKAGTASKRTHRNRHSN